MRLSKSLSFAVFAGALLAGCAVFGLQSAKTVDDKIIYAQTASIESERIVDKQLVAGAVSADHASEIQVAAQTVMQATTKYQQDRASGLPVNGLTVLQGVNDAYQTVLKFYLANGGKSPP